jgi:hypothetical protein
MENGANGADVMDLLYDVVPIWLRVDPLAGCALLCGLDQIAVDCHQQSDLLGLTPLSIGSERLQELAVREVVPTPWFSVLTGPLLSELGNRADRLSVLGRLPDPRPLVELPIDALLMCGALRVGVHVPAIARLLQHRQGTALAEADQWMRETVGWLTEDESPIDAWSLAADPGSSHPYHPSRWFTATRGRTGAGR